jgi:hypothetical protein
MVPKNKLETIKLGNEPFLARSRSDNLCRFIAWTVGLSAPLLPFILASCRLVEPAFRFLAIPALFLVILITECTIDVLSDFVK